jgi:UDP-GlcNAc:undecaprenyl-phosphate/decaprenyl-phosphate GlcNAc-1-phosphate transferase
MIIYFICLTALIVSELLYFRLADKFNIIDKPNLRSSHTKITIRGGGIIFYIASLFYFIYSDFNYPYFFSGLTMIAIVSFIDDIKSISNRARILIHCTSVLLLLHQLGLMNFPWFGILIVLVITIGSINAVNFMDGINGLTGGYSLILISTFIYLNNFQYNFVDNDFLIFTALGIVVFIFFNFRKEARCFAGDVGSVSIAFINMFILLKLIIAATNPFFIMFLAVYGVDSVLTIIHRLTKKENIFKAHRSHLYQVLVNQGKLSHIKISIIYMLIQLVVNVLIFYSLNFKMEAQLLVIISILAILAASYILIKYKVMADSKELILEHNCKDV